MERGSAGLSGPAKPYNGVAREWFPLAIHDKALYHSAPNGHRRLRLTMEQRQGYDKQLEVPPPGGKYGRDDGQSCPGHTTRVQTRTSDRGYISIALERERMEGTRWQWFAWAADTSQQYGKGVVTPYSTTRQGAAPQRNKQTLSSSSYSIERGQVIKG